MAQFNWPTHVNSSQLSKLYKSRRICFVWVKFILKSTKPKVESFVQNFLFTLQNGLKIYIFYYMD